MATLCETYGPSPPHRTHGKARSDRPNRLAKDPTNRQLVHTEKFEQELHVNGWQRKMRREPFRQLQNIEVVFDI